MTNCYFQHCTSHMLHVLNGKQRIFIKLIIKIVLMACLMCFHTDLERKLSVRTTREDLIKKGILPVTNEGNRSLLHLLWHQVWFQTCYKYLTTKTFCLVSFANSFCVTYTQLNVGSTGTLEVEGVLKQLNLELLTPTFSSPRESTLKICQSRVT